MKPGSLRNKRYRARQKADLMYAELDLPNSLTSHLIACGALSEADSFSPKKVGEAFLRFVMVHKKTLLG